MTKPVLWSLLWTVLIESVRAEIHDYRVLSQAEGRSYLFHDVFTGYLGDGDTKLRYLTERYAVLEDASLQIRLFTSRVERLFLRIFDRRFRAVFGRFGAESFAPEQRSQLSGGWVGPVLDAISLFEQLAAQLRESRSTELYYTAQVCVIERRRSDIWQSLDYGLIAAVHPFSQVLKGATFDMYQHLVSEGELFPDYASDVLRQETGADVVYEGDIKSKKGLSVQARLCETLAPLHNPYWIGTVYHALPAKMRAGDFARFDDEAAAWAAERRQLGATDTVHFVAGLARAFRADDRRAPFIAELCAYVIDIV